MKQTINGPMSTTNKATRLDAHDIANRIMREENYFVALFNRDILDLSVHLPGGRRMGGQLTRTLEWNLRFCLLDYLFGNNGQVRTAFLKERRRDELIEGWVARSLPCRSICG